MLINPEWFRKAERGAAQIAILSIAFICILASPAISFELSSDTVTSGKNVVITGTGEPNREHVFQSSFAMDLPVTSGRYGYETEIKIPKKPNRFTLTATNVENLDAAVKMGIWITKSFDASGGVVHLSADDVPPGRYKIKLSGSAAPRSNVVPIAVEGETSVVADSKGRYRISIDTTGIPEGEYRIEGDGDTKIVQILSKNKNQPSSQSGGDRLMKEDIRPDSELGQADSGRVSESEETANSMAGYGAQAAPQAEADKNKGLAGMLSDWLKR